MDKKAEAMTKKCFDGLFQIWEKMGSENLRKDKVDYILKNFEDILEIYVIIEKKDMEKRSWSQNPCRDVAGEASDRDGERGPKGWLYTIIDPIWVWNHPKIR